MTRFFTLLEKHSSFILQLWNNIVYKNMLINNIITVMTIINNNYHLQYFTYIYKNKVDILSRYFINYHLIQI